MEEREMSRIENNTIHGDLISVSYLIPADNELAIAIMDEAYLSVRETIDCITKEEVNELCG